MNEELTQEQHHPYGPSRWPGLCVCPGYESRKGGDDKFAKRGTAIHKAVETGDYTGLLEEDKETAQWMTEELMRLTQGLDTDSETKTRIPKIQGYEVIEGVFGTCDRRWETEDGTQHYADFKSFSKIGEKDYKPQNAGYVLGCKRPQKDAIVCHIFHGGSQKVETYETTWGECLLYAARVSDAIENPDAPRCRSSHCDNCGKAGDCPESAKVIAYGTMAAGRITADMVRADPASAARLCDWLDMAASRIKDAKDLIGDLAKKEGIEIYDPITGIRYGVQEREGRAEIPPLGEFIDSLVKKDGVAMGDVLAQATLTLTALRELVGKNRAEEYAVRGDPIKCFVRKGKADKMLK